MKIIFYTKEQWMSGGATEAHYLVFDKELSGAETVFDFAALVVDEEKDAPVIYSTFQELGPHSVNLGFGGSFPAYRGSPLVAKAFSMLVDTALERYKMVSFMTKNDNYPMLKLGFSKKFKVTGLNTSPDGLFLENTIYRGEN